MKYFTRGWTNGELSDKEAEGMPELYRKHISEISPRLPPSIAKLAAINLHDTIIEQVRLNEKAKTFSFVLVAGDLQRGYWGVDLKYSGVQIGDSYLQILRERTRDRETCILYDELDAEDDGHFVHRLLFWPQGEISIWFLELAVNETRREDRRVHLGGSFIYEE